MILLIEDVLSTYKRTYPGKTPEQFRNSLQRTYPSTYTLTPVLRDSIIVIREKPMTGDDPGLHPACYRSLHELAALEDRTCGEFSRPSEARVDTLSVLLGCYLNLVVRFLRVQYTRDPSCRGPTVCSSNWEERKCSRPKRKGEFTIYPIHLELAIHSGSEYALAR
jgi:hypothetical protein